MLPGQAVDSSGVTRLLSRLRSGDQGAAGELAPLVYDELRKLAGAVFSGQGPGHTLQPTALVNEAWLKLAGHIAPLENRRHFIVVAGKVMRQVITDHARGRLSEKRGGGRKQLTFDTNIEPAGASAQVDLIDLDETMTRLAEHHPRHARVAELRLFSGLSLAETAIELGVSERTIDSDWAMAKAWLRRELGQAR